MTKKKTTRRKATPTQRMERYKAALDRANAKLERVEILLTAIGVPKLRDADERLIWLIHKGVQSEALKAADAHRDLGKQAIDRLKQMVRAWENRHADELDNLSHPAGIVRWARENL